MKTKNIILAALLTALPSAMTAQENIQKAFDTLRESKHQKEVSARYNVEKNPDTGQLEGMSDVYEFAIPNPQNKSLITAIEKAFRQDEHKAYSINTGTNGGQSNWTALAVGNSDKGGVAIGLMEGSQYIYACFLDPDDAERQHRYAYALEWVENDGIIKGKIVKTYATTQKFREGKTQMKTIMVNGNKIKVNGQDFSFGDDFPFGENFTFSTDSVCFKHQNRPEVWLSQFNSFKNLFLKNPDGVTADNYATQIYKLCKNVNFLDDSEKDMIIAELEKLKKKTKDEFIQQLFDTSIERLKK